MATWLTDCCLKSDDRGLGQPTRETERHENPRAAGNRRRRSETPVDGLLRPLEGPRRLRKAADRITHQAGLPPRGVLSPEPHLLPLGVKMKSKREAAKKRERKSRFFVCFWPDADATDLPAGKEIGSDSVLAVIAVSNKELIPVVVEPKATQSMETPLRESDSCSRKKPRRFLGLKEAIFGNAKGRVCDGKIQQDPRRSSESAEIVLVEPVSPIKPQEPRILKTDSNSLSPSSSSSPSSTVKSTLSRSKKSTSSSRRKTDFSTVASESRHGKQAYSPLSEGRKAPIPDEKKREKPAPGPIIGLFCFLAFSLSATVIWGRAYAILFTSIWSCFFGRRREFSSPESSRQPESSAMPPEPNSSEYRKRVIMEGILERSHRRRAPWPAA